MKLKNIIASALFGTALSASATNISVVDFSGAVLNPVTRSNGNAMPNTTTTGTGGVQTAGARIRIGYFNTAGVPSEVLTLWAANLKSDVISNVNNAMSRFVPLGEATSGVLGIGANASTGPRFAQRTINSVSLAGRLAGSVTGVSSTTGTADSLNAAGVPAGTRIFLLVYSDFDTQLNIGEEFGVFSAENWLMPADSGVNLSLNTTDVDLASEIYRGSFGSLRLAGGFVPEPSTSLMALLAGMGLIARRRR